MHVLIAVASRHGSTREIADRIATVLERRSIDTDVVDIEPTRWLDAEHDAYIVGSAVYLDRWDRPARTFIRTNQAILASHPLWLFSSGPLDDANPLDKQTPPRTGAPPLHERDHHVFGGRLDHDALGPLERAVTRMVGAHSGDYRDWDEIDAWAEQIATELVAQVDSAASN